MTKAKHTTSAAQRREQERVRRKQRDQNTKTRVSGRRRGQQHSTRNTLFVIGGIVVVLVLTVAGFIYFAEQQKSSIIKTAKPDVFKSLTTVSPDLLSSVNTGGLHSTISSVLKPVKHAPLLKGPNGKPQVFYMGGEFCPYCGAQRWAMIIALSKFGTFERPLTPIVSSESLVPTYSFYKTAYKSQYLDFVPIEVSDNQSPPKTQESLSPEQQQLVKTYDAPPYTSAQSSGSYPFMSVGNQFVSAGSYFSPTLLTGHTYTDIISQMKDPTTDISRGMLGAANYIIAQICKTTSNQPDTVCTADPIPSIQGKLPRASLPTGHTAIASIRSLQELAWRRYQEIQA
ncbi:hypothetical protein KDW_09940 [Dictyobacter vulcani]|uniref:DUF929 domain-containing protein n=1 Tax=Dictyobacter vulcani TaxID=2607529 RepID=A0A5J4KIS5_9CHLR|nr:DUF929 family protein [Dictyobacter vulcani]GER86832.1 hypothetical protein KDW_09940 [Dictyobacter vulcani]